MRAVAIIAALVAATAYAGVPCTTGFVEFECPDEYPICCRWEENDVAAACCPPASTCSLADGQCVLYKNATGGNWTFPKETKGINVGVSEAAAFITFAAIGFIVSLVLCAYCGARMFGFTRARRDRRIEEERQRMLADSDEEQEEGEGSDESDVDDEGQCTLCFAHTINCVLMPCAHVCTCKACAARLTQCPICRADVVKWVPMRNRLFLKKAGQRNGSGNTGSATARSNRSEELTVTARGSRPGTARAAASAEAEAAMPRTESRESTTEADATEHRAINVDEQDRQHAAAPTDDAVNASEAADAADAAEEAEDRASPADEQPAVPDAVDE